MSNAPKVELKSFKHAEFASEETNCFEAVVWINGKPAFRASNEGRGGCDNYTPVSYDDAGRKAMDDGMALLKAHFATLPPVLAHGTSLVVDMELFIGDLVTEKLLEKDAAKLRAKFRDRYICFEEGEVRMTKKLAPVQMTIERMEDFKKRHPAVVLLNLLPPAEQELAIHKIVRNKPPV